MDDELKSTIRSGEPAIGNWVSIGHPAVAELSAGLGFDFVTIDTEHAPLSVGEVERLLRAVDAADGETGSVVRVAWNDPVRIKRVLDAGPDGLMVPMVETREEAEAVVDAVRYPPAGSRGIAAGRASNYGLEFESYVESANDSLLTVVQIESERGVENAADIASVEGIDALFVGPADLSASLGVFGEFEHETFRDAIERIVTGAHDAGAPVGTLTTEEAEIPRRVEQGFDFLVTGVDAGHLVAGNERAKRAYADALGDASTFTPVSER